MRSYVEERFAGKIQILVNNAGVNPVHGWKVCMDVMIYGVMMGSFMARDKMGKTKVPILSKNEAVWYCNYSPNTLILLKSVTFYSMFKGGDGGRVINIASMAGLVTGLGKFDDLGYTVSKWGTVSFTR